MIVEKPEFSAPVLLLDDFLSQEDAKTCLQECIDLKPIFMPASVGNGPDNRRDDRIRKNEVVMLDTVFGPDPKRSKLISLIKKRIHDTDCNRLWHEDYYIFDVINYATWEEYVLSRYGRCNFYGKHQDTMRNRNAPNEITRRIVTLVYYLNTEPEKFTGGNITFYEKGLELSVKPKHNRAVVFPSFLLHSVDNVNLDEDVHENGRFSVNIWMGFR